EDGIRDRTVTGVQTCALPISKSQFGGLRYMASAEANGPLTFEIHWSSTYPKADREVGLGPMPAHLLEARYRADKMDLLNDPYFKIGRASCRERVEISVVAVSM